MSRADVALKSHGENMYIQKVEDIDIMAVAFHMDTVVILVIYLR